LTASCTTGWTEWIHGDLWLLPHDGLLRLPSGLARTIAHTFWPTVDPAMPITKCLSVDEARQAVVGHSKAIWIPRQEILEASLRSGIVTDRLRICRTDGTTVTLFWSRHDKAKDPLWLVLERWIGSGLTDN
jgi:hypothetical protein